VNVDDLTNRMSTEIILSRPVEAYTQLNCPQCGRLFEYPTQHQSSLGKYISIQCCYCRKVVQHCPGNAPNTSKTSSNGKSGSGEPSSSNGVKRSGRKIGTQERPLETGYYDILGVPVNATDEEIKKAYSKLSLYFDLLVLSFYKKFFLGRLAIKHHPDKNRGDPDAEARVTIFFFNLITLHI
jgi:hypothetical protein